MTTTTEAAIAGLPVLGVRIPGLKPGTRLHPEFRLEPPVQITKTVRWDTAVRVGAFTMLHGPGDIVSATIGRYCSMAPGVVIGSNEHAMEWLSTSSLLENPHLYEWNKVGPAAGDFPHLRENWYRQSIKPITIGNDVWIGQNAFVRGGVTIGDGAVIGAMSNVVADVPPYAIVAGNPARLIRYRFDHETIVQLMTLRWWRFSVFDLLRFDLSSPDCADAIAAAEAAGELVEYAPEPVSTAVLCGA